MIGRDTPPLAGELPLPDELAALRTIVEGTAHAVGDSFFRTLVQHLAKAMNTRHAFVSEFLPPRRLRTIAFWSDGAIVDNIEYDLAGTPCEDVIAGGLCLHPSGVRLKYPESEPDVESYLGVPLKDADGRVMGHLCVYDEAPMAAEPRLLFIFQIFAARAAAELARLRIEGQLAASEQRLRDLFDEAPIAYVQEDLESRFISANRAARRILGITEAEVKGMVGRSLVPQTREAQQRVNDALAQIGRGNDAANVVLELRRKCDGKPVWIQWWSRPDPSGTFTRTMFIDITDKVLMEQEQARLRAQNVYLQEEIKSVHNFEEIIGADPALLAVLEKVRRVAATDATVLISGETGTGKELVARAIHSGSARADKPFIKLNCAALPPGLVESELFGHEKGAFSGALQRRIGRFELAQGGTIFLDEIGEMPLDVQVKLLRVLQEHEFERVGGTQTLRVDVRVVAATNRDLSREIRAGSFRADLYYRLNVFPLALPSLRERSGDIPLLVQHFVRKHAARVGRRIDAIDAATMQRLAAYPWPGNIRELENIVERALILSSSPVFVVEPEIIGVPDTLAQGRVEVPAAQAQSGWQAGPESPSGAARDLDSVQREHILATLQATRWVVEGERGAARQLGMKPATLRHRMKRLGISRADVAGR